MSEQTVLKRYTIDCKRCGRTRNMARVQSELGKVEEFIVRWCWCPLSDLFIVNPWRSPRESDERDPEAS